MVRIAELSKEVAKEYRDSKKDKLKRTFVTASTAAESKISEFLFYCVDYINDVRFFFVSERLKPDPGGKKSFKR